MSKFVFHAITLLSVMLLGNPSAAGDYDIAILNGRVIDPETGLDAVRNVGISGNRIAAITEESIAGKRTVEAQGHIVTSGIYAYVYAGMSIAAPQLQPSVIRQSNVYPPSEYIIDPRTNDYFESDYHFFVTQRESPEMTVSIRARNPEWIDQWDGLDSEGGQDNGSIYLATYGELLDADAAVAANVVHPGNIATVSRLFRHARERAIPLMDIVRHLSYVPAKDYAQFLGYKTLKERGRMQEGAIADVTIIDPGTIRETPELMAGSLGSPLVGMPYIIVAGEMLFADGRPQMAVESDVEDLNSRAAAREIAKMQERQLSDAERGNTSGPHGGNVQHHGLAGVMQLHGVDGCCELPKGFGFRREF